MIDINELRRLAHRHSQCALSIPVKPAAIFELLDRLEAAESALSNLGVTPDEARDGLARHKATLARLEAAEKELDDVAQQLVQSEIGKRGISEARDALRAEVEAMEKQFPICRVKDIRRAHYMTKVVGLDPEAWLDALPGAQPAQSVPEGWIQRGVAELEAIRNRQDDDTLLDDRTLIERIGKAMLEAAPEVKP